MTVTEQKQKEILLYLSELLSGLYTQQAVVTGLLSRTLPGLSESEKKALEDNANRNQKIAATCDLVTMQIQAM